MHINPGTERAIQTLAEHLPKLERTLEAMTKELKRYNDRIMERRTGRTAAKMLAFPGSEHDPG